MSKKLQQTVLALAIVQAFAATPAFAQQQTMQEVVITGAKTPAADRASVGGFGDAPLLYTPASITAIGLQQMQDLSIRSTTDASKFDASIGDAYNAVGYAEQFSIRGFALDNTSSYRKDGLAIPGDTQIPLENKERIEVLKGLSGLTAGVAAPGGIVNYVTKRATAVPVCSVTFEVRERGTVYGAADIGEQSADKQFGYRINAAGERLRSYVKGADGERQFVSGAFDWRISPQALLQVDADYQHKSQITAPGYQLIQNLTLPTNVSARTLLNAQPWTRPVDTTSANLGLRFEYQIDADWRATASVNKHRFTRDDYTAFPYGCSNEGSGYYPGYCSNGDYDVYDYQSTGEKKSPLAAQLLVQGKLAALGMQHELAVGASSFKRHDSYGDYVYDYAGSSNIYQNAIVDPAPGYPQTGPVFERRAEDERAVFVQDIVALSPQFKLHAGLRHVKVDRNEYGVAPSKTSFTLPNVALVFNPTQDWSLYASVAHGLEHGGVAPIETSNANKALDPSRSKQFELGVKGVVNGDTTVSAALFQIRKGLEYTQLNADATSTYVRKGEATHRGLELAAQGKLAKELGYSLSMMAIDTQQDVPGAPDMDGKQVTNVPKFKAIGMLDYSVDAVPGLKLNGVWVYAGKKAFDIENRTMVPAYSVFDLGAAYATRVAGMPVTLRATVQNAFDKFYWRDVTPALGGYLIPGAPRTLRASAQFDF